MKQAVLVLLLIVSLLVNGYFVWDRLDRQARADEYVRVNVRLMVWNLRSALSSLEFAQKNNWTNQPLLLQAANALSEANQGLRTAADIVTLASDDYESYFRALPFDGLAAFSNRHADFVADEARKLHEGLPLDISRLEKIMQDLAFANFPIQVLDQPEQWAALREAADRLVLASSPRRSEDRSHRGQNVQRISSAAPALPSIDNAALRQKEDWYEDNRDEPLG